MRRTLIAFALVLFIPTGAALAQTFGAVLTGSQESPPTTTPGFGNATVSFTDATHTNINVTITVANLGSPINNFHIHELTPPATTGGVIINLIGLGGTFVNGKMTGTFPIAADVASRMIATPQNFYINVHTVQFGTGAIRGFLTPVSGTVINYAAELRGSNEVPPTGSSAFGSAFVTVDTVNNIVTWEVDESGVASPTLSHIHGPGGSAGTNAGVFVTFATNGQIVGGRTKGTVTLTAASDITKLQQLVANPADFYVNLHSTAFGGGEIRGQLVPAKEVDLGVAGKVGTFATDVRVFNPSYDAPSTALLEYFPASTTANTNATNTMVVNIPARGTANLNDVTGSANLNAAAGIGAIRVSSASAVNATSRIFSSVTGVPGTFGQFLEGIPRGSTLRRGVLAQLENDTAFRTNVGFFNPNNSAVTVRLELRNEAGVLVASSLQTFNALAHQQSAIGTYFSPADLSNQPKLTLSFDSSAPIVVYAAVNDNTTTDSFVVVAQEDTGVAANQ